MCLRKMEAPHPGTKKKQNKILKKHFAECKGKALGKVT
jgi:hypothetical protein